MKLWKVIFQIAGTHLVTRLKSTVTATIGVTFGIGGYITLVGFMTGLNTMLDDLILNQVPHIRIYNEIKPTPIQPVHQFNENRDLTYIIHSVKPKQNQERISNALPILEFLENDAQILGVSPQLRTQIFYASGTTRLGGNLVGVDILKEAELWNLQDYIIEGKVVDLKNADNGIFLGIGIAKKLSLFVGDRIMVTTAQGDQFPLKIIGFYQSGIADIDNIQSYTNLKTVQRMLGVSGNYMTDINIKLKDVNQAPEMASKFEKQFNVSAIDINAMNAQFETGSFIRNLITYAVSITLLVVAGFGIYNILNMLIYEKMNDIAILKAIGFSGKDVEFIFLIQALVIGISGGLIGILGGYLSLLIIDNIAFTTDALPTITTYPVNYNLLHFFIGITFALICSFIAGYLPARKAKKMDPVTIIRGN